MNKGIQEEAVGKNAHKKIVGLCNRCERRICAKEGEGVSVVKGGERRGKRVCKGTAKKGLHSVVEITTNGAGILCRKEGWEEKDGAELPVS